MKKLTILLAFMLSFSAISFANTINPNTVFEQEVWEEQANFENELNDMLVRLANGEFDEIREYAGQFARAAKMMAASNAPESVAQPGLVESTIEIAGMASDFAYQATGGKMENGGLTDLINEINEKYNALDL
jgi:hypothetical protein